MKKQPSWEFGCTVKRGPKLVNEDRCYLQMGEDRIGNPFALALVADGMGGYQRGDKASELVISKVQAWSEQRLSVVIEELNPLEKISNELDNLLYQINEELLLMEKKSGIRAGTTVSLIFLYEESYLIKHIGDSRIYQFSQNVRQEETQGCLEDTAPLDLAALKIAESHGAIYYMNQLTEDHSWVEYQVQQGLLTREEARVHPKRNMLIQCLGIEQKFNPFQTNGSYKKQDLFMLCSDGFYALFQETELASMVLEFVRDLGELQSVTDLLVKVALQSPNVSDNISVLMIRPNQQELVKKSWKKKILSIFT